MILVLLLMSYRSHLPLTYLWLVSATDMHAQVEYFLTIERLLEAVFPMLQRAVRFHRSVLWHRSFSFNLHLLTLMKVNVSSLSHSCKGNFREAYVRLLT